MTTGGDCCADGVLLTLSVAVAYLLGIVNPALTPFKIIYSKYKVRSD